MKIFFISLCNFSIIYIYFYYLSRITPYYRRNNIFRIYRKSCKDSTFFLYYQIFCQKNTNTIHFFMFYNIFTAHLYSLHIIHTIFYSYIRIHFIYIAHARAWELSVRKYLYISKKSSNFAAQLKVYLMNWLIRRFSSMSRLLWGSFKTSIVTSMFWT